MINILATFGNGRKSGLRVRPSLTKHLCDLDVLRLTQGESFFFLLYMNKQLTRYFLGPNKDFRITAAFREQGYKNDLEIFCVYVGYRLESSNFEFKIKEPRRSGIMVSRSIISKVAWEETRVLTNATYVTGSLPVWIRMCSYDGWPGKGFTKCDEEPYC